MRRDISLSIALQEMHPIDSSCTGIRATGLLAMRQALLAWEKKQGIERPKYGRGFNYGKKTEPKEKPKPKPKAEKKPRAPRRGKRLAKRL